MKSVAIIGAGITGLTAAFYLKRKGVAVTLYEASGRTGGVIQSLRRGGFLAESGPNTLLETSPKIAQLIRDAGLQKQRLDTEPKATARYVVGQGSPILMPGSPLGFMRTKLFSLGGKMAVLREPFVKPRRDGGEESIAEFVVRRLNQEFLDRAVDALVAGVYAGDPYKLSVTHAFPRLKALEDNYGSLIKGQIFGARDRKKTGEVSRDRAPKLSFDEGLQVLPDTLAKYLGDSLRLNSVVHKLTRAADGWTVTTDEGRAWHDVVIYCGTAYRLAGIELGGEALAAARKPELSVFSEIRYPPVAAVVLGFRREDVTHPCEGFGMLVPKVEGFKILGTIFSSSLFPNRASKGHLTLTSYIGGERYPELARRPDDEIVELVLEDLRALLGVRGRPVFVHCATWARAIPQYNVGYGSFKDALSRLESEWPGLFFAGHYRDGVSLSDSIVSGANIIERVIPAVKP